MKKILSILTIAIFFLAPLISADVILESNGDTTVSGNMEVQGTLTGTAVQQPLSGSCPVGSSLRIISPDGSIFCETDNDSGGDITGVQNGSGLSGGGTSGNVTLSIDPTYTQRRVSASCAVGKTISAINEDGSIVCDSESDPQVGENTLKYVPIWDGDSLVSGSIFDDRTNVGIGTGSPTEKLTVDGIIETSEGIKFSDGVVQTAASGPTWHQILPAAERFVLVMNDEAVLDKETGLVWEQSPSTSTYTWEGANNHCITDYVVGGRLGWRLPSVGELSSLVDKTHSNPTLPSGHPFSNVQSDVSWYYWSATTVAGYPDGAWYVGFYYGLVGNNFKTANSYVWCVRGGPGYDGQ